MPASYATWLPHAAFFGNVAADLRLSLWTATPAHASALSAIDTRSDLYMLYTNIEEPTTRSSEYAKKWAGLSSTQLLIK